MTLLNVTSKSLNKVKVLPENFWGQQNREPVTATQRKNHTKGAVHKFNKTDLINAVYVLSGNESLTVSTTIKRVKEVFGVDIKPGHVYSYRLRQRKRGNITPHDTSASLTTQGLSTVLSGFVISASNKPK